MNGFLILGAILILVAAALVYHYRSRILKAAAEEVAAIEVRKQKAHATAETRNAAWAEFDDELTARINALYDVEEGPEFIVSLLVGEDYPRYGVFFRTYEVADYKGLWTQQCYGVTYPGDEPPEQPALAIIYEPLTEMRFDHERDAQRWLDFYLNPHKRQNGYTAAGKPLGSVREPDAELDTPFDDA